MELETRVTWRLPSLYLTQNLLHQGLTFIVELVAALHWTITVLKFWPLIRIEISLSLTASHFRPLPTSFFFIAIPTPYWPPFSLPQKYRQYSQIVLMVVLAHLTSFKTHMSRSYCFIDFKAAWLYPYFKRIVTFIQPTLFSCALPILALLLRFSLLNSFYCLSKKPLQAT